MAERAKIVVDGVELAVRQRGSWVTISKMVGKDRVRGRANYSSLEFELTGKRPALLLIEKLHQVAVIPTARCTCDYRYGHSDHAKHCYSIDVASDPATHEEDD